MSFDWLDSPENCSVYFENFLIVVKKLVQETSFKYIRKSLVIVFSFSFTSRLKIIFQNSSMTSQKRETLLRVKYAFDFSLTGMTFYLGCYCGEFQKG